MSIILRASSDLTPLGAGNREPLPAASNRGDIEIASSLEGHASQRR
jgi:hypothetical protein